MRPARAALLIGLMACAALVSAAETFNIRPGLWKTHTTLTFGGAPLYIAEMNDAQRANYAKSWAQQVNKPSSDDDEDCITAKDIQEATLLKDLKLEDQSCKESNVRMTGTVMTATIDCKSGKTSTHIEVDYVASSPTALKGTIKSSITSPNGVTTMTASMSGTFKAASCPKEDEDEGDE
jgi:hypothetical protein